MVDVNFQIHKTLNWENKKNIRIFRKLYSENMYNFSVDLIKYRLAVCYLLVCSRIAIIHQSIYLWENISEKAVYKLPTRVTS